jgi:DUF1009 family protein
MSASKTEKSKLEGIKVLGIIAGGGRLPFMLLDSCRSSGVTPYILAFEGHTDPLLVESADHIWTSLGALQKNIDALKAVGATDIVFCGDIKRPSIRNMKPDLRATKFFARHALKALGDDALLSAVKGELTKEGFVMHGVHAFLANILAPAGLIGSVKPSDRDLADVSYGFKVSQELGRLDVGQSVVVQDNLVIGVEAVEGTDALISRSKNLLKDTDIKGVLVKTCKPQQDKNLDLPTIGVRTIDMIVDAGLSGVAVHSGNSMIVDIDAVIDRADKMGVFVYGVSQ